MKQPTFTEEELKELAEAELERSEIFRILDEEEDNGED